MNEVFVAALGRTEAFRGLGPHQLRAVVDAAERIVFRSGETIIAAGAPGLAAILLVAGDAAAIGGESPTAGTPTAETPVVAGCLVGEMAMLIEHDYRVTVVARSSVRALRIDRSAMHALMLRDPAIADHFQARIASRLTRMAVELRRIDQMLALAVEVAAGARRLSA